MSELLGGKGAKSSELLSDEKTISELVRLAREKGDPTGGSSAVSCLGCHKIGSQGGLVGPDLPHWVRPSRLGGSSKIAQAG